MNHPLKRTILLAACLPVLAQAQNADRTTAPAPATYRPGAPARTWNTGGNAGLLADSTNYIGTTDAAPLNFRVNGRTAGRIGAGAGNTVLGYEAWPNGAGTHNTVLGYHAGLQASGPGSDHNTILGNEAFLLGQSSSNVAIGHLALRNPGVTGGGHIAIGNSALNAITTGNNHIAIGHNAMYLSQSGERNTVVGGNGLFWNRAGSSNTALGWGALYHLGLGPQTNEYTDSKNSSSNTALGCRAGEDLVRGTNNLLIGYDAQASDTAVFNEVTLGNSKNNVYRMFAASWTNASDRRLKHDIRPLGPSLGFVRSLRPVAYVYNNSTSGGRTLGFVAQDVQASMSQFGMARGYNLVSRLDQDYLGLNTTELIPMLTKAIQEQQAEIERLRAEGEKAAAGMADLREAVAAMRGELARMAGRKTAGKSIAKR